LRKFKSGVCRRRKYFVVVIVVNSIHVIGLLDNGRDSDIQCKEYPQLIAKLISGDCFCCIFTWYTSEIRQE